VFKGIGLGHMKLADWVRSASAPTLKLAKSDLSPQRALAELRKIQRHRVRINKAEPISGISTINDSQADVLQALNIRKPTQNAQLSLL